jgi:hypothetical protein
MTYDLGLALKYAVENYRSGHAVLSKIFSLRKWKHFACYFCSFLV